MLFCFHVKRLICEREADLVADENIVKENVDLHIL